MLTIDYQIVNCVIRELTRQRLCGRRAAVLGAVVATTRARTVVEYGHESKVVRCPSL